MKISYVKRVFFLFALASRARALLGLDPRGFIVDGSPKQWIVYYFFWPSRLRCALAVTPGEPAL